MTLDMFNSDPMGDLFDKPRKRVDLYELAETLDPLIPAADIRWLMGRVHVATPVEEVRAMMMERTASWHDEAMRQQAADYAVACHEANGDLCRALRL